MHAGIVPPLGKVRRQGKASTDEDYLIEAKRIVGLAVECGLRPEQDRILDIGCGAGRFLTGMLVTYGRVENYVGLDVRKEPIEWCREAFGDPDFGNISFQWMDVQNARYHPSGEPVARNFKLPVADASFDFVILYSVFSHMTVEDTRAYLFEIARVLHTMGRCLCTAIVADNVPDWKENPKDFLHGDWRRPLHCVRFNRALFEGLIEEANLKIVSLDRVPAQAVYTLKSAR